MNDMPRKLRPLTQKDLDEYEWVDVSAQGDENPIWIRGIKKTHKPNDGFIYTEDTRMGDTEKKWKRVFTYADD